MKKNTMLFKINLLKDDFNITIKVGPKQLNKKERILLRIALFSLKNQIEKIIPKI
ncbi:MAG: hypothetical protein WCR78_02715 [Arcobacteraceae bacterium]